MKSNTAITLFSTLYCIIFTAAEEILFSNYIDLPDPEPINKKSNKNQFTSRIVGGHDVDDWKTYPFIVSWYQGWNYYPSCGGSLVAPNLVLTAAHCQSLQGGVRIGSTSLISGGVTFEIKRKIGHPSWNNPTFYNDFMILELDGNVDTTKYKPIDLNFDNNEPANNDLLTTIGFGKLSSSGKRPDKLQEVTVPAVDPLTCFRQYPFISYQNHLCAGYMEGGKDTCQGDSGGPIFKMINGEYTQVGITSFGAGCAFPDSSGVYSRISGAENWLKQQICSLSNSPKPHYCSGLVPKQNTRSPTAYPTFPPTPSPIVDPTASPTIHPTLPPTPFPIATPTGAPTPAGCTICNNEKSPWMIDHNVDCSAITPDDACKLSFFITNGYCRDRCFHAGYGFPGDNCCEGESESEDETEPTPSPTRASSDLSPNLSFGQDCIVCDDEPISWMTNQGMSCEGSPYLENKCNRNGTWRSNKYCQLSCYNANSGYEGDVCCQSIADYPSESPSTVPVGPTVIEEEEDCTRCDDIGNPWMQDSGISCNVASTLIERKCNKNGTWRRNKYCQNTCYHSGRGYEGDVCCNSNKTL